MPPLKVPKYLVSVAEDPTVPPQEGNTLHLEFDWWLHMAWVLWRDHKDAVLADRYLVVVTTG